MNESAQAADVSRETIEKLEVFVELLKKWSPKINLVAKSTLDQAWDRHIVDSLQVAHIPLDRGGHWVDLGSGGGFPGLVAAIVSDEIAPQFERFTLVESDQRKAAFLRTVLRETSTTGTVIADRIELVDPLGADVLSARALAPLEQLLGFSLLHSKNDGISLFPKGKSWQQELQKAKESFSFSCVPHNSETQEGAAILQIGEISRV